MTIETLAFGYGLIEGPRVGASGNLYFSDVPNGGVYRRSPDGKIETVVPKRRGVGGIALHADGGIVITGRDVSHVRGDETRILLHRVESVFGDLCCDAEGSVIVGAARIDARDPERFACGAVRITRTGVASTLCDDVLIPNGIGISPSCDVVYHVDSARRGPWQLILSWCPSWPI